MNGLLKTAVLCLGSAILCGCSVPALNTVYSEDVRADDPELAGSWVSDDGRLIARVERVREGEYTIASAMTDSDASEKPRSGVATGRLVRLGERLFIDLVLHETERQELTRQNNFMAVRTYQVLQVTRDGDVLTIRPPSYDRMKSLLVGGQSKLAHTMLTDHDGGPELVITASTAELQAFYRERAADEALFGETLVLRRGHE
jgi:hypothetical protein